MEDKIILSGYVLLAWNIFIFLALSFFLLVFKKFPDKKNKPTVYRNPYIVAHELMLKAKRDLTDETPSYSNNLYEFYHQIPEDFSEKIWIIK